MSYLPTVAWYFWVRNVIMVSMVQYRITVERDNVNDPGADTEACEVGHYIIDYVGNIYQVQGVVSRSPLIITVGDILGKLVGPQQERLAVMYKSAEDGISPIMAPVNYSRLDPSAEETVRAVEVEVVWQNKIDKEEAIAMAVTL